MKRLILPLVALAFIVTASSRGAALSPASQQNYDTKVRPFLASHCFKCHGEKKTLAGLRLDTLETDFLSGKTADVWKEMYDRLGNRTMPPKKEARPDANEVSAVTDWIIQELANAEKLARGAAGRIPTRRLNRTEYCNTLRDLFYLDDHVARALEQELPADGKVDGFDRGGAGLFIDEAQMAKYLELADLVLSRDVFGPEPKRIHQVSDPQKDTHPFWPDQGRANDVPSYPPDSPLRNVAGTFKRLPLGVNSVILKDGGLEYVSVAKTRDDELNSYGFRWSWGERLKSGDFQDGWYRLKFHAGAFKGTGKQALREVKLSFEYGRNSPIEAKGSAVIDAPIDQPRDYEIMVYLRPGAPGLSRDFALYWHGGPEEVVIRNPELKQIEDDWSHVSNGFGIFLGRKNPPPTPEVVETWKKKLAEADRVFHERMQEVKTFLVYNPEVDIAASPRLRIESVELDGPIGDWPPKGQTELFADGQARAFDTQYIREIFTRFLPRAYRRAVTPGEIDDAVSWALKNQEQNNLTGHDAVVEGVKMVLCSPGFLMIQEPAGDSDKPRQLTDYELACRLSYFLWSTMPDAQLFKLAADHQLHDPKTLQSQVLRMIADPKGSSLVINFTGQWLKVRDFSSVITDRVEYKSYDNALRDSSWREPHEFFKEILGHNLSILNFLDSNFVVIDARLAAHYGIEGVTGDEFRRVAIGPELHRGGVLGMAGVLTFLSDGTRTLPVRRGAYVLEALWNTPPRPPPPNVGDLPAVGKVKTVRERLELHRKFDTCASCHAKIDPFGLALENYDAIGAWRERMNGEHFKGDKGSPPLDVSGTLPSGREFKTLDEFKQALLAEKERFVHAFTEKMLTYALGRPVGATDRATINQIMQALEPHRAGDTDGYRLQDLIQAVVASQPFQTK